MKKMFIVSPRFPSFWHNLPETPSHIPCHRNWSNTDLQEGITRSRKRRLFPAISAVTPAVDKFVPSSARQTQLPLELSIWRSKNFSSFDIKIVVLFFYILIFLVFLHHALKSFKKNLLYARMFCRAVLCLTNSLRESNVFASHFCHRLLCKAVTIGRCLTRRPQSVSACVRRYVRTYVRT